MVLLYSRGCSTLVLGLSQLDLHPVDAIHAVYEEDQDEDECNLLIRQSVHWWSGCVSWTYLHAILELSHYGALGDEGEEATLDLVRQRDNQGDEDGHLEDQEAEDLAVESVELR